MIKFNFFHQREKFLILEISPQKTEGLLLGVDQEKNLIPEKIWKDFSFRRISKAPLENLKKRKLIVSAHPSLVTTISLPLELKREPNISRSPLTLIELENLLSQAIGRMFNQRRAEASLALGLGELDTILVNAKVGNFKVDGHFVLNPVGFGGNAVDAVLELTFTTRQIFDELQGFFNDRDGFFFTGSSRAGLLALSRIQNPPVSLILMDPAHTFYFVLEKAAWGYRTQGGKLDWSLSSLFKAIASSLGASRSVVLKIYDNYLNHETSEHFSRALARIIKPIENNLFHEIKKSRLVRPVYLFSPIPLPFSSPHRNGRVAINAIPLNQILEKTGFKIDLTQWPLTESEVFTKLVPFLEFYYDKSDLEINQKLRRRLHWLAK